MRADDRQGEGGRQRHLVSSQDPAIGAGVDLRIHGQAIKAVVYFIPDEDHDQEERLRASLHHQQEDQLAQFERRCHRRYQNQLLLLSSHLPQSLK